MFQLDLQMVTVTLHDGCSLRWPPMITPLSLVSQCHGVAGGCLLTLGSVKVCGSGSYKSYKYTNTGLQTREGIYFPPTLSVYPGQPSTVIPLSPWMDGFHPHGKPLFMAQLKVWRYGINHAACQQESPRSSVVIDCLYHHLSISHCH